MTGNISVGLSWRKEVDESEKLLFDIYLKGKDILSTSMKVIY
jgi:hypothetical protein